MTSSAMRRVGVALVAILLATGCATVIEVSDRGGDNPADFGFTPYDNGGPTLSRDGRYAVFLGATGATDPVPFDETSRFQAYRRDNATGAVSLVSRYADGAPAGAFSVAISGSGRYVAFVTSAALVADDTNAPAGPSSIVGSDVYVRDMDTGTVARASLLPDGKQFGSGLQTGIIDRTVFISDDGATLAFGNRFDASDVVVYVRRVATRTTKQIHRGSVRLAGISGDGRHVVVAPVPDCTVVPICSPAGPAIELDWQLGTSTQLGTCPAEVPVGLSFDGRFAAVSLVGAGDPACGRSVVWRFDRSGGVPRVVSADTGETPRTGLAPSISRDGDRITFVAPAALTRDDANPTDDVYTADLPAGTVDLVSRDVQGNPATGPSRLPWISADGRYVAFTTDAGNLGHGVREQQPDVVMTPAVRPSITTVAPDHVARSQTTTVTIVGTGFAPDAYVVPTTAGLAVGAITRVGSTTIVLSLHVATDAVVGPTDLVVVNPGPYGVSGAPCRSCITVT
jgi:Tol biopolymer transport system component